MQGASNPAGTEDWSMDCCCGYQLTLARPDDYDRLQFKLNRARR